MGAGLPGRGGGGWGERSARRGLESFRTQGPALSPRPATCTSAQPPEAFQAFAIQELHFPGLLLIFKMQLDPPDA